MDEDNIESMSLSNNPNESSDKSQSEMDLKKQFEEFSRSLSFRRTGSRKKLISVHDGTPDEKAEISSPSEALENEDTVGQLGPLLPHLAIPHHGIGEPPRRTIVEYPAEFSVKSRPSI